MSRVEYLFDYMGILSRFNSTLLAFLSLHIRNSACVGGTKPFKISSEDLLQTE